MTKHTLFSLDTGSRMYGLATPTSDHDHLVVYAGDMSYYTGTRYLNDTGVSQRVDKKAGTDFTDYEVRRFLVQAAKGNPSALLVLFVHPAKFTTMTFAGSLLLANRDLFVTKMVGHAFAGCAFQEWNRYSENPDTRTKHAMSALRLLTCGSELLETGETYTDRTHVDATFLRSVRAGELTHETLAYFYNCSQERMVRARAASTLCDSVDGDDLDALATMLVSAAWNR
jgi:predicted nucleotidyltransferase